jgi:hypothetical protein
MPERRMNMANQPKTGTVVLKDGTYFLEAEGKLHPIPVSPKTQPAQLKELVGQKVEILYSEPKSFVAGLLRPGHPPITCYFQIETFFGVVPEEARVALAKQLLNEGLLSQETFNKLSSGGQ